MPGPPDPSAAHPDSLDAERARDAVLARLSEVPGHLHELRGVVDELRELVELATASAQMGTIRLTAQTPLVTSNERDGWARSVGVLNPNPIVVYLGIGGARGQAGSEAIPVPANSALTVPVNPGANIEIGAAPADVAASDAVLFLFRYKQAQPLTLGVL